MPESPADQAEVPVECLRLTRDLPGVSGTLKTVPEDFVVEEIPAYEPCGEGDHLFLWVESRDVDGRSLLRRLAAAFEVDEGEVASAGTKDRFAITRQWFSVPASALGGRAPAEVVGEIDAKVAILDARRHTNKLRTGHLRGNRFELRVRELAVLDDDQPGDVAARIEAIAARLRDQGVPNYYGEQRFGREGQNLSRGLAWLKGGRGPRGRFQRKMAVSAVQSEVFNRVLRRRLEDGSWRRALAGDVFEKLESGGRFWVTPEELAEIQERIDAGELVITGPMPGYKEGLVEGAAGQIEQAVLSELGLTCEMFRTAGKMGRGARRALTIAMPELRVTHEEEGSARVAFELPSGSYATVVMREFLGGKEDLDDAPPVV
ncbi:tRNA pseudouridine(13) synthase TruD [Lujinxingia litoralis]|uniref:tRNA pseudouridine synthase D n=1 Tax=Lujinxingia litoralis TaxID=2211119 RepID=A0A328C7Z8_9DELT|nr:tRNA pseudouridine(13) synthase TruD [Lujinxingia litoralis]RAL22790.1 tRNA pseudouridine(13) synthase TruD [Lujinxingia litoralis]